MAERIDDAALVSDAYIDSLVALHARQPVPLPPAGELPPAELRRVIDLLAGALPRLHPSFAFEEALAARLRGPATLGAPAPIVALSFPVGVAALRVDRRVVLGVGGAAIASGVSMAAVYAWRQAGRRGRVGREVIA